MTNHPDPNLIQRQAADPTTSVWVSASAGSGKTKVLTDRVLALLVNGASPDGLLCVTFTKASASEMANRIHRRLSQWTQMSDPDLSEAIRRLDGSATTPEKLNRARRLFATVLDLPGGLRIRTIHSFCQSVLGRFPLEAGISPNFTAMDERDAQEAMALARDTVLTVAAGHKQLKSALAAVTSRAREDDFAKLTAELAVKRGWLAETLHGSGGLDQAITQLHAVLNAEPGIDELQVIADACAVDAPDEIGLTLAADALQGFGSKPDKMRGRRLAAWLAGAEGTRMATFDDYQKVFLTKDLAPRQTLCVKAVAENSPATPDVLAVEQARLLVVDQRLRRQATARASEGLLRLGESILRAYELNKQVTARLDYDDLIQRTARLLSQDAVPWVLFKLDGGLNHLLIDEAQDTSTEQRAIVDALVVEFFSDTSAHGERRTLFVVGDAKQSIFSFQGADPEGYRKWHAQLDAAARTGGQAIKPVPMDVSFRSVPAVLDVVDATFAENPASDGVVDPDAGALKHFASEKKAPLAGRVELWPPTAPPETDDEDLFKPALTDSGLRDATQILAEGLAATVDEWLSSGTPLPSEGRPIGPGDILFLVQRRTLLIDALVRELQRREIPVAGVDRMRLTEQIAVMDLVALCRALLLPQDDLTFACLMKSPLVGFDDDDLLTLAYRRGGGVSLWQRLKSQKDGNRRFAAAAAWFDALLAETDRLPPFELLQRVLTSPCPGPGHMAPDTVVYTGRQALTARLGHVAEDPLEEFLSLALDYERSHTPSLEGFLVWFERGKSELKRDLDTESQDKVRIMTAHGAKGLQAKIVILPDAYSKSGARSLPLRWYRTEGGMSLPIWTPATRFEEPLATSLKQEAQAAQEREYRRLLYVALTRAESRLIVTGRLPKTTPPVGTWYELVAAGLDRLDGIKKATIAPCNGWAGTMRVYETGGVEATAPATSADRPVPTPLPDWLTRPTGPEPSPPRPLAPSRPISDPPPVRSPTLTADGTGFQRGRLIHRLLQTLPNLPQSDRPAAAERYLSLPIHDLQATERRELTDEVFSVLDHPVFAPLFGCGSRAEVPLTGLIQQSGESFAVSGQVDRLLISDHEILVVDYKTLRFAPTDVSSVPAAYLSQMAGYRAILSQIFPDRPVRCALVFTETPRLVTLPDTVLDRHA